MSHEQVGLSTVTGLLGGCVLRRSVYYLEVHVDVQTTIKADIYQRFVQHEKVFGYSTASPARLVNLRAVHRAYTADAHIEDSAALSSDNGTHTCDAFRRRPKQYRRSGDQPLVTKTGQTFTGPVVEQATQRQW